MKQFLSRTFLAVLILLSIPLSSQAYDFEYNGLCYNITSEWYRSVEVTYLHYDYENYSYVSGNIEIPKKIQYNDKEYTVRAIGELAFCYCSSLTSVTIPYSVTSIGKYAFYSCSGLTKIVVSNSVTSIEDCAFRGCENATIYAYPNPYNLIQRNTTHNYANLVLISIPRFEISYRPHQESCEFTIRKATDDEPAPEGYKDLTVVEYGVICEESIPSYYYRYPCDNNGKVTVTDLKSKTKYYYEIYAVFDDGNIVNGDVNDFTTKELIDYVTYHPNPSTPTTFEAKAKYTMDDAVFKSSYFTFGSKTFEGNNLILTGLKPNTEYKASYTVTTQGGSSETRTITFTTAALELELLDPRPVSEKCAIVAARTNISDLETSAGFQWRKYDAPTSLKSSEAYAAIYDGRLEGYIKNLQSTSYYNVRAFYKYTDDIYYYSDWVTFDPSDFSYFEPTVHTYPTTEVASTTATVKGYALAGSDEITGQGIEYWSLGSQSATSVEAALLTTTDGVNTVFSTGQVMTITLVNLEPETTYCYRAFVTTQSGTTYGEEQTFTTTESLAGVESVKADKEHEVIGYYDLTGRRHETPQRGLNIVVYSDGKTEKVFVRE